jgi:MOSC domain-containing protein YiiM
MKVASVNIGKVETIPYKGRQIKTGIFKYPVSGSVKVGVLGLEGDAIVDLKHHGGLEQAVYAYASEHYDYWKMKYPDLNWEFGMFGENLTISGLDENYVHEGDQFSVGDVILEVTKPREPCMKLGIRFGTQAVLKEFWNNTRSGIYFKVLQEGTIAKKDLVILNKTCKENPTIAQVYEAKKDTK